MASYLLWETPQADRTMGTTSESSKALRLKSCVMFKLLSRAMPIRHNERFLIPMIDAFDLHQLRQAAAARADQVFRRQRLAGRTHLAPDPRRHRTAAGE